MYQPTEFMYKGVQVNIRLFFGYCYIFEYAGQKYSSYYDTEIRCKDAAKEKIDYLLSKTDGLGVN